MITAGIRPGAARRIGSAAVASMAIALITAPLLVSSVDAQETTRAAGAPEIDPLIGLWKGRQIFGPEPRGTIILERTSSGWRADFAGSQFALQQQGEVLSFSLPGARGSFRAKLDADGGVHHGQWIQQASSVNPLFATGVRFDRDGASRWRGEIQPIDDTFTFYLPVAKRPDGTLGTFIRNPERNVGVVLQGRTHRARGRPHSRDGARPWRQDR